MKKNLLFPLFVLIFIFSNCKKNDLKPNAKTNNYTIALLKMGFDTSGIIDMGSYFVVEKDIVINKSELLTHPRQAYSSTSQLVDPSKQRSITVRIDPSVYSAAANFNWSAEVPQAIAEYNSLETSNIRFQLVSTPSADIVIKTGFNGSTNVIAEAPLPSGGNPGSFVQINTNFSGTNSSSDKKWSLIHELGHCIGFKHTNWYDATGTGPFPAVGNSPNDGSNRDWMSIMHASHLGHNIFSDWDLYAISFLYPSSTLAINGVSATCNSGNYNLSGLLPSNFTLTWSSSASPLHTIVTGNTLQLINAETINRKVVLTATIDYLGNPVMTVHKDVQAGALSPWDYNIKFLRPGTGVHCGNGNYIVDGVPFTAYTALEIVSNSSTLTVTQMSGSPLFYANGVSSNPYSNAVKVRFQNSCGWGNWGIYYLQPC